MYNTNLLILNAIGFWDTASYSINLRVAVIVQRHSTTKKVTEKQNKK